jgi:hypothetical protein
MSVVTLLLAGCEETRSLTSINKFKVGTAAYRNTKTAIKFTQLKLPSYLFQAVNSSNHLLLPAQPNLFILKIHKHPETITISTVPNSSAPGPS